MNQLAVSWQDKAQFSDSTGTFPNFVKERRDALTCWSVSKGRKVKYIQLLLLIMRNSHSLKWDSRNSDQVN